MLFERHAANPLADIIFNLGMTFILSELDKCREEPPSVRWEPMGGPFFWESGKLRYGFVSGGELR